MGTKWKKTSKDLTNQFQVAQPLSFTTVLDLKKDSNVQEMVQSSMEEIKLVVG